MEKWVGKVALVTGASVGIGYAIVDKLVKQGVNVVGCARNIEKLQEIATKLEKESGKFCPFQCDLRKEDEILSMFEFIIEKFGVLHICINNAGLAHKASMLEGSTDVSILTRTTRIEILLLQIFIVLVFTLILFLFYPSGYYKLTFTLKKWQGFYRRWFEAVRFLFLKIKKCRTTS